MTGVQTCALPILTIKNERETAYEIEKAIFLSKYGRPGPVWINIPVKILGKIINENLLKHFKNLDDNFEKKQQKILSNVLKVFNLINKSKRPLLIAGYGIKLSNSKNEFLFLGYVVEPDTIFSEVKSLEPGTLIEISIFNRKIIKKSVTSVKDIYCNHRFSKVNPKISNFKNLIKQSIDLHNVADVKVGLLLSSGIDSTFLAKNLRIKKFEAFTISFDIFQNTKLDEIPLAKYFCKINKINLNYKYYSVKEIVSVLPDFFKHMDQPSTDGLNTYLVTKFVKSHNIKVAISGLGSDEINSEDKDKAIQKEGEALAKIKLLETLNDEYTQLIQGIERDVNLKTANDIFTKYMLGPGRKSGFGYFIPNYKIIQYIFWLIHKDAAAAKNDDIFVKNAFEVDYAGADDNPEKLYGIINDLSGNLPEVNDKKKQFMKDETIIKQLENIIKLIEYRLKQDQTGAAAATNAPSPEYNDKKHGVWPTNPPNNIEAQRKIITKAINTELAEVGISKYEHNKGNNGASKIAEIKAKIRELKGKHFTSMLIFYNYIQAKKTAGMADIAEIGRAHV